MKEGVEAFNLVGYFLLFLFCLVIMYLGNKTKYFQLGEHKIFKEDDPVQYYLLKLFLVLLGLLMLVAIYATVKK